MPRHFPFRPDAEHGYDGNEWQKRDGHDGDGIDERRHRIDRLSRVAGQQQFLEECALFSRAKDACAENSHHAAHLRRTSVKKVTNLLAASVGGVKKRTIPSSTSALR